MTVLERARVLRRAECETWTAGAAAVDAMGTEHYLIAYDYACDARLAADRATRQYTRALIAEGVDTVRATHSCWRILRIARNT